MNMLQLNMKGPTKLELQGRKILETVGVRFEEQVSINNKFIVDALLEKHIVVQWDGDYWHGHPTFRPLIERQRKQKVKDRSEDAYLRKCGYIVIRVWAIDIKKHSDRVIKRIRRVVEAIQ